MDQEQIRFRSFAERYVIERASGFKSDNDAWAAVQDAMRAYKMIEQQSAHVSRQLRQTEGGPTQAGATGAMMTGVEQAAVGLGPGRITGVFMAEKQKSFIRQWFGL